MALEPLVPVYLLSPAQVEGAGIRKAPWGAGSQNAEVECRSCQQPDIFIRDFSADTTRQCSSEIIALK